jgi:hypothetical protein
MTSYLNRVQCEDPGECAALGWPIKRPYVRARRMADVHTIGVRDSLEAINGIG